MRGVMPLYGKWAGSTHIWERHSATVFGVHKTDHSLLLDHFLFVVSNNLLISGVVLGH